MIHWTASMKSEQIASSATTATTMTTTRLVHVHMDRSSERLAAGLSRMRQRRWCVAG
jgi:hypothetical protein